jgi:hypothetical protein
MSPARKVLKTSAMCPHCGEEQSFNGVYCFRCGGSVDSAVVPSGTGAGKVEVASDNDPPARASYLFVCDGLLFTELWYVPVSILVVVTLVVLLTLMDMGWLRHLLVGLLAATEVALIAWLLLRNRSGDRRDDVL